MKNNHCNNCGGPVQTIYRNCKYCGTPVLLTRQLTPEDYKRMSTVAKIIDNAQFRNIFKEEHKANRLYVYINLLLLFILTIIIFYTSCSLILTALNTFLLGGLIVIVYYKVYWANINEIAGKRVFKENIEPAIEEFLQSFNYYGGDWDKVLNDLIKEGKLYWLEKFIRSPESHPDAGNKSDSVL